MQLSGPQMREPPRSSVRLLPVSLQYCCSHGRSSEEVNVLIQEEEEGIGDVDLFTLTVDKDKLTVNSKWLQHLQVSPALTLLMHRPSNCAAKSCLLEILLVI